MISKASMLACLATVMATQACAAIQGHHAPRVRPSSGAQDEYLNDVRVLERPSVLATAEDAIVRIVGPTSTCTGTAIDEDLILTAHHCLVERGADGELTKQPLDPAVLRVELGGGYFAWGEVGVRSIVAPPCGEAGGAGDVAVLVLKRKLIGLSTMQLRDAPPRVGEIAYPVGFGRCTLTSDAIKRKDREGGPIRALSSETLRMDAAICPGDSGGPVFTKGSREIIGVVSLSAMDHNEATRGASVMARVDAYRLVVAHARAIADGTPVGELPPLECGTDSGPSKPTQPRTRSVF